MAFCNPVLCRLRANMLPLFCFILSVSSVLYAQCCQCVWVVHSCIPLRFSITFINHVFLKGATIVRYVNNQSGAGTAYPSGAPDSSPPVFSGVRVTRSLVLYECIVDRCLSSCTFSFGHCVVCSSAIYRF